MKKKTNKEILDRLKKWATNNIKCSHILCSSAEAAYEEIHGKQVLDILNGVFPEEKKNV